MENQVTNPNVLSLIESEEFHIIGKKTTVCLITCKNGFEIIGTSACVNPADFDKNVGEYWAHRDAVNKLEEYSGFLEQQRLAKTTAFNFEWIEDNKVITCANCGAELVIDKSDEDSFKYCWSCGFEGKD